MTQRSASPWYSGEFDSLIRIAIKRWNVGQYSVKGTGYEANQDLLHEAYIVLLEKPKIMSHWLSGDDALFINELRQHWNRRGADRDDPMQSGTRSVNWSRPICANQWLRGLRKSEMPEEYKTLLLHVSSLPDHGRPFGFVKQSITEQAKATGLSTGRVEHIRRELMRKRWLDTFYIEGSVEDFNALEPKSLVNTVSSTVPDTFTIEDFNALDPDSRYEMASRSLKVPKPLGREVFILLAGSTQRPLYHRDIDPDDKWGNDDDENPQLPEGRMFEYAEESSAGAWMRDFHREGTLTGVDMGRWETGEYFSSDKI